MKFDVRDIIVNYFATIKGERWTLPSAIDATVLFVLPFFCGFFTKYIKDDLGIPFFLNAFTLFGVFFAVFMAVQGVLVPLYHTPPRESNDPIVMERLKEEHHFRNILIREVSSALSYLKFVSLSAIGLCLISISINSDLFLFKWITVAVCIHMFLNMFVILKRINSLFMHEFH